MHNGQVCAAGTRLYVQEGIYDAFVQAFAGACTTLKAGDQFDVSHFNGPLVSQAQVEVSMMATFLRYYSDVICSAL